MKALLITTGDPEFESFGDEPTVNVRRLLNRIPDAVVLSVSTRSLDLGSPTTCLCAWAVREEIARTAGIFPETVEVERRTEDGYQCADDRCAELFGGDVEEWSAVFEGVTDDRLPVIELAWVERVDKAVRRA